jgi:hypothetical protein
MYGITKCAANPGLAVTCPQEPPAIRDVAAEQLSPNYRTVAGIDGPEDPNIAQCIEKTGLILFPGLMKEGCLPLRYAEKLVMEVDVADFVSKDRVNGRGKRQQD